MSKQTDLLEALKSHFQEDILAISIQNEEVTAEIKATQLTSMCLALRDQPPFLFSTLVDICGIDYKDYGLGEWVTDSATHTGFDRGTRQTDTLNSTTWSKPRFAAIYHLLSLKHNHRLRLRVFANQSSEQETESIAPTLDSVTKIWPSANWYEREAFDLYGIQFHNHPDLRRLLTDYDFEGHPFRKDFPMSGKTEVRYDAKQEKVIYEPVNSVTPRTIIPKVIRQHDTPSSFDSQEPTKENVS